MEAKRGWRLKKKTKKKTQRAPQCKWILREDDIAAVFKKQHIVLKLNFLLCINFHTAWK